MTLKAMTGFYLMHPGHYARVYDSADPKKSLAKCFHNHRSRVAAQKCGERMLAKMRRQQATA